MSQRTRANAVANIGARVWGVTAAFVFLPVYLRILGSEAFGLVALFTTLQVSLTLAFTGWTKALRREFAREESTLGPGEGRRATLNSYQVIYGTGAFLIVLFGVVLAQVLSRSWLTYDSLSRETVAYAIGLMSASVAVQLIAQAFSSALHGMRYQQGAVLAEVVWSLGRSLVAVLACLATDRSPLGFFAGLVVADIFYAVALRIFLTRVLQDAPRESWRIHDIRALRRLAPMSAGLTVIAFAHLFNTQTDRFVIGRILGLESLGTYNVAAALGQLPVAASTGLAITAFPLFVRSWSMKDPASLQRHFHFFTRIVSVLAAGLGTFLITYRDVLLVWWIRDPGVAAQASLPSAGLIAGGYFLAMQQIPYEYLLAQGITRTNVLMSLLSAPAALVLTPLMVHAYGLVGASLSWCLIMGASTCAYLAFVSSRYLGASPVPTLTREILFPTVGFGTVALLSRQTLEELGASGSTLLAAGVTIGGLAVGAVIATWARRTGAVDLRRIARRE